MIVNIGCFARCFTLNFFFLFVGDLLSTYPFSTTEAQARAA